MGISHTTKNLSFKEWWDQFKACNVRENLITEAAVSNADPEQFRFAYEELDPENVPLTPKQAARKYPIR